MGQAVSFSEVPANEFSYRGLTKLTVSTSRKDERMNHEQPRLSLKSPAFIAVLCSLSGEGHSSFIKEPIAAQ